MKLRQAISALATPLLAVTVTFSGSNIAIAAAPETGANTPSPRDRATTTLPGNASTTQRAQRQGQDSANTEAQGRANSQQPQQHNAHTPDAHDCSPGLAGNDNAQGGNPEANINAQGSRAQQNQSEQGVANSNARIAQGGDDCVPGSINRDTHEDARGQGTGNTSGNNSSTNSPGATGNQTRGNED